MFKQPALIPLANRLSRSREWQAGLPPMQVQTLTMILPVSSGAWGDHPLKQELFQSNFSSPVQGET